jgi:hypothetical protein
MPPRTTRKSYRPRASDRTMVGTAQPICLSASGTERRRHDRIMNLWSWIDHRVSLQYEGWTARPFSRCLTAAGEAFVLTSPFIERDYRALGFRANGRQKPRSEKTCGFSGDRDRKGVLQPHQFNHAPRAPKANSPTSRTYRAYLANDFSISRRKRQCCTRARWT